MLKFAPSYNRRFEDGIYDKYRATKLLDGFGNYGRFALKIPPAKTILLAISFVTWDSNSYTEIRILATQLQTTPI